MDKQDNEKNSHVILTSHPHEIYKDSLQIQWGDKDPLKSPELLEHFGISVIEAMIYGLYPIVYSIGGPSESIKVLNTGETFNDFDSLFKILKRIIINFDLYNHSIKENFLDPFYENNNVTLDLIKKITLEK